MNIILVGKSAMVTPTAHAYWASTVIGGLKLRLQHVAAPDILLPPWHSAWLRPLLVAMPEQHVR